MASLAMDASHDDHPDQGASLWPRPALAWPPPRDTTSAGDLRIPCSLSSSPGPVFDMDAARIGSPPCFSARQARHRHSQEEEASDSPVVHWIVGR